MKRIIKKRTVLIVGSVLALAALGATQIKQVIKVIGVGAAVSQFGPQINKAINGLTKHEDSYTRTTKVVPIISVGTGRNNYIGAAQVTGPRSAVEKVKAVAQPELGIFGNEIRIRALIPVASEKNLSNIKAVDGVGVSGIVDLRL